MEENNFQVQNDNPITIKDKKAPIGLIIFSGLSFIPAIGVFFGIISIMISLFNFKRFKLLFILGLSGIMLSIIIYSTLYYFGEIERGGVFDKLSVDTDIELLKQINIELANYKLRHGVYPSNLIELNKEAKYITIEDPIIFKVKDYKGDSLFYYQLTSDSVNVFSVGMDGKPFTKDDIHSYDKSEFE